MFPKTLPSGILYFDIRIFAPTGKVGKDEADLKQKLIFFQSPISKGRIGKKKNDLVEITTPSGMKNFEIKDVKYI